MTQTSNRLFDEMARLMGDAASVAQGVKREVETAFRAQIERFTADMDLVKREQFDVVREMASQARTENEALKKRIAELEVALAKRLPELAAATTLGAGPPAQPHNPSGKKEASSKRTRKSKKIGE
jgi:BMFP domain-containing protein YqiC